MAKETDKQFQAIDIPLNGKLITGEDPALTEPGFFSVLKNLRYTPRGIKGVSGMTKINTSALTTYTKVKSGIQFTKDQPSENHVLVQAYNSGETASVVYKNDTAIPSQGGFNATAVHTDATGAGRGRFSKAPDGCVAYANGVESMIWGGDEYRCGKFINYDGATDSFDYDYTEKVTNTKTDTINTAYLKSTSGGLDSNTKLLLHCEGADASTTFTDSSASAHTVTAVGNAQIDDAQKKFGSTSGLFDGSGDYLTIPSHADFDFSGGSWSIDFRYRTDLSKNNYIYSVGKDAHTYFHFYSNTDGALYLEAQLTIDRPYRTNTTAYSANDFIRPTVDNNYIYECTTAGTSGGSEPTWSTTVNGTTNDGTVVWTTRSIIGAPDANFIYTPTNCLIANTWHHVEITQSGSEWFIFVDAIRKAYKSDARRLLPATSYATIVNICEDFQHNAALSTKGWIDEFRISKTARHTNNFTPTTAAYAAGADTYLYVGSTMPIEGVKFYVNVANTTASTCTAYYWDGTGWVACTNLVDGTSASSKSLAQTGSITFDSTVGVAKTKIIDGTMGYWYKFIFSTLDADTGVYYCTLKTPFQPVVDIWDGSFRTILSYQVYTTNFNDYTTNIKENEYVSGDTSSYSTLNGLTSSQYQIFGSSERLSGLTFHFVPGSVNTTAATTATVSYWDGSTWVSVGTIDDGTAAGAISFNQSGIITWNALSETVEFSRTINGEVPYYYYKLSFDKTLSSSVLLYYVGGITSPNNIKGYKFPLMWQNRFWLFSEQQGEKNKAIGSSVNSVCVFNGSDKAELNIGDDSEITVADSLYTRFGSSVSNDLVVCKKFSTWVVTGNKTDTTSSDYYNPLMVSNTYGCVAPETFIACDTTYEVAQGINKHVLIWQAANGIIMFDGVSILPIHQDISNFFDPASSDYINESMIHKSTAFYDERNREYHWLFANGSSTTLNKEWVFSLTKKGWYEINRGTNRALQYGLSVVDTVGNNYCYGFLDTGYMERLEYGTSFDGGDITYNFRTADKALMDSLMYKTSIRKIKLLTKAKNTTATPVTITHYGDTKATATTPSIPTLSMADASKRLASIVKSIATDFYTLHSLDFSVATNNETIGFEPMYLGLFTKIIREDIK